MGRSFSNTGPGGFIQTLTGNSGGPVGPTAGNINLLGTGVITVVGNPGTSTLTVGITGTTNHAVQVGNAAGGLTSIAVGTTGQVLTGVTGGDPVFAAPAPSSISITGDSGGALTGNAFTFTGGATGLTFSGAVSTETLTGTLVVAHGGSGAVTFTAHGVILGEGTSPFGVTAAGTTGQVLTGVTGGDPIWAAPSGGSTLTITTVNNAASPYTVLGSDQFLAVNTSGGAVTIRLPNAPATGTVFYVKDSNGTAAASNITVTTVGGAVNIDGATSFVMNTAYESISVVFDGSAYEIF